MNADHTNDTVSDVPEYRVLRSADVDSAQKLHGFNGAAKAPRQRLSHGKLVVQQISVRNGNINTGAATNIMDPCYRPG